MSERTVTLRHDQVCDLCHEKIAAGEKAYLIRDDFWPMDVWFEHKGGCPETRAADINEEKNTTTQQKGE